MMASTDIDSTIGENHRHSHRESSRSKKHRSSHRPHHSRSPRSRRRRSRDELPTLEELGYQSKKYSFFDIPANGFENIQPSQYFMMVENGQLPKLIYLPQSSLSMNSDTPWNGCFVNSQAKRLYVGNIPSSTDEAEVVGFFNSMLEENNLITSSDEPGKPVTSAQVNVEKNFAFIEIRSVEETTNALILDGIEFHGCPLKIRRPRDYQPVQTWSVSGNYSSLPPNFQLRAYGSASSSNNANKLFIKNLPPFYGESELKNLLSIYGQVVQCEVIKDGLTSENKGLAIAEYSDATVAEEAIKSLDGMRIDGHILSVQSSLQINSKSGANAAHNIAASLNVHVPGIDLAAINDTEATKILCLLNMIDIEELRDDEEYEDICDDIRNECEKFGNVISLEIPRPKKSNDVDLASGDDNNDDDKKDNEEKSNVAGLGKVFVEFETVMDCRRAFENLSGRKFSDKIVVTSYFDTDKFHSRQF